MGLPIADLGCNTCLVDIAAYEDLGKSEDSEEAARVMDIVDQLEAAFHLVLPLVKLADWGSDHAQMYNLSPIVGSD